MVEAGFLSDADFERYRALIYRESGIHFTATNRSILESRLRERLRDKGVGDAPAYYRLLATNHEELAGFLDAVTTNLTRFFRNQAHFDALEHYVVPEILRLKRGGGSIRIWSAGCSTGEEPYSIAMLMSEILPPAWRFDVVASDLSLKCLLSAKEGFYSDSHVTGVPGPYLEKYFDKVDGGYRVKKTLAARVRFDYHNLMNDAGLRGMDIVFCRNVIIYFDEAAQLAVIRRFWDAMAPKSFLFIGHSESLFGMDTQFQFVKTQWATFYRKYA